MSQDLSAGREEEDRQQFRPLADVADPVALGLQILRQTIFPRHLLALQREPQ